MTNHSNAEVEFARPVVGLRHTTTKVPVTVIGCATRSGLGDLDGVWAFCEFADTLERIWVHTDSLEAVEKA